MIIFMNKIKLNQINQLKIFKENFIIIINNTFYILQINLILKNQKSNFFIMKI